MRPGIRLLACVTLLCAAGSSAYTTKTGNVSGQTWAAGTYYVSGALSVNAGSVLTLEPGAVVKFAPAIQATIGGTLIAAGTEALPIVITSRDDNGWGEAIAGSDGVPAPGDWRGVYCNGFGDAEGSALLQHCRLRYGGGTGGTPQANLYINYSDSALVVDCVLESSLTSGLRLGSCSPLLERCVFHANQTNGVTGSASGTPAIWNCSFTNNAGYGAWLDSINPGSAGGNSGSGNGVNGLGLSGTVAGGHVLCANADGFPYLLINTLTVESPEVYTLGAGVKMKALGLGSMTIRGTLNCLGASDSLVVITSIHDDTVDGDTNGNAGSTTPAPGDWRGIYCNGFGNDVGTGCFDWTRLCYGGNSAGTADANLYCIYSDGGHFLNSSCEMSSQCGLKVGECNLMVQGSAFIGNLSYGIHGTTGASASVHDCAFTGNGGYAGWIDGNLADYGGNSGSGNAVNGLVLAGVLTTNRTWSANAHGFACVLSGSPDVADNVILTLGPGVVIKGLAGSNLNIAGTLIATGTPDSLVVFTSLKDDSQGGDVNGDGGASNPAPGDWYGLEFAGFGDQEGIARMDWCRLSYGGNSASVNDANVYFGYGDESRFRHSSSAFSQVDGLRSFACVPDIEDCAFQGNLRHGIYSINSVAPAVHDCAFSGNGGAGAVLQNCQLTDMSGNSGSGNGLNGIKLVNGSTIGGPTWGGPDLPFVLGGSVVASSPDTLHLLPGTIVKGESAASLEVQGALSAIGTDQAPILFSSSRDDLWGGDTNGDGAASQPAPGDWVGVYCIGFSTSMGTGDLQHCRIRYGGAGTPAANLCFYDSAWGCFQGGSSESSLSSGVRIYNSSPVLEGCRITDNTGKGVYIESGTPNLGAYHGDQGGYNVFMGNNLGGFQVWNASPSEIDACYNDWGVYTEAEIDALIRDDDESAGAGVVDFYPWIRNDGAPLVTRFIVTDESVSLTWTPVNSADHYVVSSCDTPYGTFVVDGTGVFNNNRWNAPLPAGWRFYQVRAVTD